MFNKKLTLTFFVMNPTKYGDTIPGIVAIVLEIPNNILVNGPEMSFILTCLYLSFFKEITSKS